MFARLVQDVVRSITDGASSVDSEGVEALQTAAEAHLVEMFRAANAHAVSTEHTIVRPRNLKAIGAFGCE